MTHTIHMKKLVTTATVLVAAVGIASIGSLMLSTSVAHAAATTYYVSNGGNDSANGTSPSSAWRTLAKVNSATFSSGDQILLERGDIWRETLTVNSSGSSGNNIVYSSYGTGNAPLITPSVEITNWSLYSGQTYVATVSHGVSQVALDGVFLNPAHYPSSGYRTVTSAQYHLTDANLSLSASQVQGATAHYRPVDWTICDVPVSSYDSGSHTMTFGSNSCSADLYWPHAASGYYLTGKAWMLDSDSGWAYDSGSNKLYVRLPDGSNPSSHLIEASNNGASGISASGRSGFTLTGHTREIPVYICRIRRASP